MSNDLTIVLASGTVDSNVQSVASYVKQQLADYQNPTYTLADLPQAKRDRAAVNAIVKDADARRLAAKREFMAPWDALEARIKDEIIDPGKKCSAAIDEFIKRAEAQEQTAKRQMIADHYLEYAGILPESVPFERIEDPKWMNKSVSLVDAFGAIEERVNKIADDEAMLSGMDLSHPVEAKAVFLATLDVSAAMRRSQQLDAQEEAARKFEADKAAVMAGYQAQAEASAAAPQETPEPLPAPAQELPAQPEYDGPADGRWTFQFICTEDERDQIIEFCRSINVKGRAIR